MSCAYFTNEDIAKIVRAAIRLNEGHEPSRKVIESIADGDEDIPVLIRTMAGLRFFLWTTLAGGIHLLELERELDLEDMGDKHDPLMHAVLKIKCAGYDLNFTSTPGQYILVVKADDMQEGVSYQLQGGQMFRRLTESEVMLMAQDLKE